MPYEGLAAKGKWTGEVRLIEEQLGVVARWKKGRRVFVCSMSDLFQGNVADEQVYAVLRAMRDAPQHQYIMLTKRPTRAVAVFDYWRIDAREGKWMLGVSVEHQGELWRLGDLSLVGGVRHWVSLEPLLGPVDFGEQLRWLDWVVVGPETGPGARECKTEWITGVGGIVRQCREANVPCFVKRGEGPKEIG